MAARVRKGRSNGQLRVERRRRGWTQEHVANLMQQTARTQSMAEPTGLNANYISRWERGIVQPDPYHAFLLCLTFGLPAGQLGLSAQPGHQEAATNRRQFAVSAVTAIAATVTDGTIAGLNSELWDWLLLKGDKAAVSNDVFDHFLDVIDRCWGLLNSGDMSAAERILISVLPDCIRRAEQQSGATVVAAEGLRLLGVIRGHHLKLAERVTLCQEAVEYARRSGDRDAIALSLTELAVSFKYGGQFENSYDTYLAALPQAERARPLVRSRVSAASAAAFAQRGATRQFERYSRLAYDVFPSRPEAEQHYFSTDNGLHLLAFYEGVAHISLGRPIAALDVFESFMQNPLAANTPLRNRLEIVNQQGRASIMARDLEQYAALLEAGTSGALTIGSRKRFDEAIHICRKEAPAEWRREPRIRAIIEPFNARTES